MLKRFPSILLLLTWLMLGSGALAFAHNLQHAAEDQHDAPLRHDDTNCRTHAQVHSPAILLADSLSLLAEEACCQLVILEAQITRQAPRSSVHGQRGPPAL